MGLFSNKVQEVKDEVEQKQTHIFKVFDPYNNAWIVSEVFDEVEIDYEIDDQTAYTCYRDEMTFDYKIPNDMLIIHVRQ